MKNIYFATKSEAYEALKLSLQTKVDIIKAIGYDNLNEKDVFNYLIDKKWETIDRISLSQMVSDILNINNDKLIKHFKLMNFIKEGGK